MDLISRQKVIDAMAELQGRAYTKAELKGISKAWKRIKQLPSVQPDDRLAKIADLVEGTIDHFDLDDAMDLLYQIKEVLE